MGTRSKEKKKKKAIINALPKPKLKQIPIKQQNISLLQFSYSSKDPVSTATIQQAAKTILQNANAKIDDGNLAYQPEVMATVLFDKSIGWQSGKFSGLEDDEVDVYRFEDQYEYNGKPLQTTYSTFNITLKLVANAGGSSKRSKKHPTPEEFEGSKLGLNDCLWYCLRDLHSGVKYMPSAINKPFLQGCDGVTVFPLSRETLSKFWMKPKSCKHIYRQAEKATSAQEMLAEHRALEADIKILKDASKGFVNLYRQLNETKSALFIFAKLNRLLVPPPKLGQLESTHFDIKVARDIGLNIELLPCQPNALLFPTRVPAASIFKPFVDYIFDLRQQTQCPRA